ncbi:FecR family protein [Mucilaginibacter sp.]|uniref:FecR family protein n=1 Tax=Mucilaginibacter sp. TaxID=1882438 RepID=UPI003D0D1DE2
MDKRVKELFGRYQAGEASKEECKIVEDWFAGFNNEQQEKLSEEKTDAIFGQMDQAMHAMLYPQAKKLWFSSQWLQVAAILLIATGLFLFRTFKKPDLNKPLTYTLISAPKGVKKQCALPDGTFVYLNSGSSVRISSNFGVKDRQVELLGEAYFVVTHNAAKPFNIHAGNLVIADIGTAFNVKAYPEDKQIRVAVESGEVSVQKNSPDHKPETFASSLTHNQQLIYDRQSESHVLNEIKTDEIIAWKQNQLRFDNASMEEISTTLERWYNITIKLNSNAGQCRRYTVSFNNEPVTNVLKVLKDLSGMSYQIDNRTISIHLKNCKKP